MIQIKNTSFKRGNRGYSLVEVLIAAVIIGIAIVSVFQAVSNGTRMSRLDFLQRRAYQYCEQILEMPEHSYKGSSYTNAVDETPTGNLVAGTHNLGTVVLDDKDTPGFVDDDLIADTELQVDDFVTSATIDGINAAVCCNDVRAKKLTARVIWTEQGETDTVALETILSLVDIN